MGLEPQFWQTFAARVGARVELVITARKVPISSVISEVAAVLLPVFSIAALGYVWRRTRRARSTSASSRGSS